MTNDSHIESEWILLGLTYEGDAADVGWIGLFRSAVADASGAVQPRTWRDYRPLFYPFAQLADGLPGGEFDFSWLAPDVARRAAAAFHSLAAAIGVHEGEAEARHDAPLPDQAGPTRPGGADAASSVTAGRDRHNFPDGAGPNISVVAETEPRRRPMLLWRDGDRSVCRESAVAARALGPCHPVYFRSLAPYRPNRAERGLRPVLSPPAMVGSEADFFNE